MAAPNSGRISLLIFLFWQKAFSAKIIGNFNEFNESQNTAMLELLKRIKVEIKYESLLLLTEEGKGCASILNDDILRSTAGVPRMILSRNVTIYWRLQFTKNVLAVVCLENQDNFGLLENLSTNLHYIRFTKTIIFTSTNGVLNSTQNRNQLEPIFKFCANAKMLNVLVFLKDYYIRKYYYDYTMFPSFHVEERRLDLKTSSTHQALFFPNRMANLYGHRLRTLPDNTPVRSIAYKDRNGKLQISGYTWHILKAFTKKINATLDTMNITEPKRIYYNDLMNYTRDGIIDIPASVNSHNAYASWDDISYPILPFDWCLMLPNESPIPQSEVYVVLISSALTLVVFGLEMLFSLLIMFTSYALEKTSPTNLLEIVLSDKSLRALLGQSIPLANNLKNTFMIIFLILFFTGLLYSNTFLAYLQSYLTSPPLSHAIRSLDDMHQFKLTILIFKSEYVLVTPDIQAKYGDLFNFTDTVTAARERDKYNTRHAYTVSSDRWPSYDEHQRYFARRIFRLSDICFMKANFMVMMLQENSIYREAFDKTVLDMFVMGLIRHYVDSAFFDLLEAGLVSYEDLSTPWYYASAELEHYYWIWIYYGIGLSFCVFVLFIEIAVHTLKGKHFFKTPPQFPKSISNTFD